MDCSPSFFEIVGQFSLGVYVCLQGPKSDQAEANTALRQLGPSSRQATVQQTVLHQWK
jgi:hypothetical protein